ncbi:MAG TPA: hypothetical protein VF701_21000 [Thermoanaerobaculia bacterium]
MTHRYRFIFLLFVLALSTPLQARMLRVVAVENGRTITAVDRDGNQHSIRLAGVAVESEVSARELLRWTLDSAWVLVENTADGYLVWRSPDALFVNRELVLRGYATATLPGILPEPGASVTYLGTINPSGPQAAAKQTTASKAKPVARPKAPKPPPVKAAKAAGTGRDSGRRSPATPAPKAPRQTGARSD